MCCEFVSLGWICGFDVLVMVMGLHSDSAVL